MQRISQIMKILVQIKWSHFIYFGLPLAKEMVKSEVWNKHVEKIRGKIQNWGMMWLNLAERTIMIKALFLALPIYQYAIIMAPASAHKHMELIIRSFLWQGGK